MNSAVAKSGEMFKMNVKRMGTPKRLVPAGMLCSEKYSDRKCIIMAPTTDIDLLLIGKTGVGKSALGNAILRRNAFQSIDSTCSVTTEVQFEFSDYKGKIIKVVDGPGVGDIRWNKPDCLKLLREQMGKAMVINPHGYHAFLLVVRYGTRFTEEDKDTIELLKSLFGQDFVGKYCILAMTHGDNFQHNIESRPGGDTFPEWCSRQTGIFQELLKECNNRIVLFDNTTQEEEKRDAQLDKLLEMVSHLQSQGQRYTDDNFQKAGALQEKALVESKKPVIQEETLQEVSLIVQKLNDEKISLHYDKPITPLQELSKRCGRLVEKLKEQDKQTGSLQDLIENVQNVKQSIDNAILINSAASKEKRKMEEKEKERRAKMDNEVQRKKQQMEEEMRKKMNLQKQQYENMIL
ncbi:immune-associated nucleotide-binding protein 9 [Plakobranchus ocellatus]|uniref:Immune-associated nucleotide-binding protein 9 n=1 Tax=Plakobranchus ocellatus TaxID=259542 RepID=A0AAV3XXW7_9GAST|nr:immune-associated nucleotide-binding protein 9 [Plakobranchus ocellatus]